MRTSLLLAALSLVAATVARAGPDLTLGKATFARCAGCHAMHYDIDGPRLCGLIGRRAGSVPGYDYSAAMKRADIVWSARTLDRLLADPAKAVPGSTMTSGAVPARAERAALIAYLLAANKGAECHGPR
ncbi:MAG: c-type cytochrome [Pseudomonadota bacterium]